MDNSIHILMQKHKVITSSADMLFSLLVFLL